MPMDRSRYAENWDEIAFEVKDGCQWECQECGRYCRMQGETWDEFKAFMGDHLSPDDLRHPTRFTLTVAHLDQDPSNNDPANLRALCAPCHLRHDAPHRKANSLAKRERAGQLPLLGGAIDG